MPKKGDNFDTATANAVADHLSNVTVEYTPTPHPVNSNKSFYIKGVFSRPYMEAEDINGYVPTFACLAKLIEEPKINDKVIIAEITYKVIRPKPDGLGWLQLELHKV